MSQTQAAPAPVAQVAPPSRTPRSEDVPRLLNRWQVVAVLACLLFAALTAGLQVLSWQANRAAADNTEQLVRVQNIQSTLFRADALATTAFLTGGLEPAEQRKAYDDAIETVTRQITDAAEAQPADREALADLAAAVNDYNATIAQARANNRQGFPVGAEYLRTASTGLRDTSVEGSAIPIAQALVAANAERASDELDAQHPFLILLPGIIALALLIWVNRQLAQRFRRRINVGIAGAVLTVGVLMIVAFAVSAIQANSNGDLRDGSYDASYRESTARTAGNDAKANESLRLISRGSGQVYEDRWDVASQVVQDNASDETSQLWDDYATVHAKVVSLDEGGQYDKAVQLSTTTGANGSTAKLDAFDARSQEIISESGDQTTDALRSGNTGILVLAVLTLLLGVAARHGGLGHRAATEGVRMNRLLITVATLVVLAGCGYSATPIPEAVAPEAAAPATTPPCTDTGDPTRSYQPAAGGLPAADDLPSGSTMAEIRDRGYLIAGVSSDSYLLASRNPFSGEIEGFDIDMVNEIATAIFGTAKGHVQLRVISAADRIPLLQAGEVDVVARNMTINCSRWDQIAFSEEYFHSGQKILVKKGSGITEVADLSGKKVCAPAGTTSLDQIQEIAPDAIPVTAGNHTGCLVKFQNGEADAITGDDTVLAGLAAQDPYAVVVTGAALTDEPYGIGVNADDVDLVRFINGVLERMRNDGSWQASYDRWLRPSLKVDATQPPPVYGR